MKTTLFTRRCLLYAAGIALFLMQAATFSSCKDIKMKSKKAESPIGTIAKQYQAQCPKDLGNGTTIDSVYYDNHTLIYRLTLSDEAIATINPGAARDSIILNTSDRLKRALIKEKCNIQYKYVSTNDSVIITIVPTEFVPDSTANDKQQDKTNN